MKKTVNNRQLVYVFIIYTMTTVYSDPVYGQIQFTDSQLDRIIQLPIVQRLKGIAQNGLYGLLVIQSINGHYPSRFEHSLGVAYICQQAGASVTTQIRGLLHDLYHTNFSHDLDFLTNHQVSFHEKNRDNFFRKVKGMDELIAVLGENWSTYFDSDPIVKDKKFGAD